MIDCATTGPCLLDAGRLRAARQQFWREAEEAEARGDVEALAAAALGLGGMWVHEVRSTLDQARVRAVQQRALARLDPASSLARRLSARLAAEHAYATGEGIAILAALSSAGDTDDPLLLADVLSLAHHCLLGPEHAALRMRLADELIAVSPITGRPLDALMGLAWRTVDLFLAGDRRAARSLTELRAGLAARPNASLGHLVAAFDVMLAIRAGRLDEAELLAAECHRLGVEVGDADADAWYGAQLLAIRWLQGRGAELLPLVEDLVSSPTVPEMNCVFVAARAVLAAEAGDLSAARAALAGLRAGGLATMPPSSIWLATLVAVCEAAHALGDADAAAEAYRLLAPYADRPVLVSLGVASYGSAHRPLGLAALTTGDIDRAIAHLEAAVVADLAVGDAPWHVVDLAALADGLDRRNGPGDRERAAATRRTAVDEARSIGMTERAGRWAARERVTPRPAPAPPAATAAPAPPTAPADTIECRRDGRLWRVTAAGRVAVVPHSVGLAYLAELIAHPGVEIPAIELASRHQATAAGVGAGAGDRHDPVLDDRARAAYRRRIEELRAEVDDAEANADLERAARARVELDRFVEELARATGFAGRSRSFPGSAERARTSVHKAIKRALGSITEVDPGLGAGLAARIVTGKRCSYRPAPGL